MPRPRHRRGTARGVHQLPPPVEGYRRFGPPGEKIQSIDELECELRGDFARPDNALAVARKLRAKILREAGPCLRSSIGIGPNWFIAKVASDMQKPDGLVVLDDADIPQKLLALEMTDFCGIGPRMDTRLRAHGIDTV